MTTETFGTKPRNRTPRDLRKTPYSELPHVIFREEIKHLYEIIEEQRAQLENGHGKGVRHAREIKLKLARVREQAVQTKNVVNQYRGQQQYDKAAATALTGLDQLVVQIVETVRAI